MRVRQYITAICLSTLIACQCMGFGTSLLTWSDNFNLPSVPTTATASIEFDGVGDGPSTTWVIDTFNQQGQSPWYVLNAQNADARGVDWSLVTQYLTSTAEITQIIDATPLVAQTVWVFPHVPNYPIRTEVSDIRFRLEYFATDFANGKNRGFLAGTYEMYFIPEPATLALTALLLLIFASRKIRRRR